MAREEQLGPRLSAPLCIPGVVSAGGHSLIRRRLAGGMEGFFKVGQTECGIMTGVHISGPAPTAAQKGPPHIERLAQTQVW